MYRRNSVGRKEQNLEKLNGIYRKDNNMELKIRNKLYKLAMWYIGKCNAKWNKPNKNIQSLDRLTYRNNEKAYLRYGADAEWQHINRYGV